MGCIEDDLIYFLKNAFCLYYTNILWQVQFKNKCTTFHKTLSSIALNMNLCESIFGKARLTDGAVISLFQNFQTARLRHSLINSIKSFYFPQFCMLLLFCCTRAYLSSSDEGLYYVVATDMIATSFLQVKSFLQRFDCPLQWYVTRIIFPFEI